MAEEKDKVEKSDKAKEEKEPDKKVPYGQLWRYATAYDKIMVFFALLAASGVGVSQPALMVVFGDMTDSFVDGGKYAICDPSSDVFNEDICALTMATMNQEDLANLNNTDFFDEQIKKMMDEMTSNTIIFIGLGIGTWICGWIQGTILMIVSTRLTNRLRIRYFQSILRQDVGYFDMNSAAEMNTRLFDDIKKVSDGVGDKLGLAVQAVAQTLGGIIIGFVYGWKMSLVVLACTPALAATGYVFFVVTTKFTKSELDSYAKAGDIAEEVLSSIRTVTAFGGQPEELDRYAENLEDAKKVGIKKQTAIGFAIGLLYLVLFGCYGLSFWYGAKLVLEDNYTIGQVLSAFFAVVIGAFGISQAGQNAEYFASAQAAAYSIYEVIDREPPIDIASKEGKTLPKLEGNIEFNNVDFTYPARLEQQILFGVSFNALAGQTVALCGQSGCGKSTCFQLLQRFYDTAKGSITIDGVDIKDLNLQWFRDNIGIVSQEPVLFDTTIRENIKMGRLDVTDEEIKTALIEANAYDFIEKLPKKLDTYVGEGGATLSGGQKQRVSIARALVRNPRILLLDEATSALDTESERLVQEALDKVSKGRTTIVIAHRLSTIRHADVIVGFASGQVVEHGPHDELINRENGVYANLYNLQNFQKNEVPQVSGGVYPDLARKDSIKSTKSVTSQKSRKSLTGKKEDEEEEKQEEIEEQPMASIYGLNKPELCYNITGAIVALLVGAIQPLFGIIFAEILNAFGEYACAYDDDIKALVDEIKDDETHPLQPATDTYFDVDQCSGNAMLDFVVFWAMMFVAIGGANFLGYTFFAWLFGVSGEELTLRLRRESFRKYLQLEMAYFDDAFNSTGALTSRLSSDAAKVQGAIGGNLGAMVQSVGALLCAFIIAFIFEWRITLVCLAFIPVLMISQALMMKVFMGEAADKDRQVFEDAGKCTTEATMNIRTVASLGREDHFVDKYRNQLQLPVKNAEKKAWLFGFLYGMSTGIIFFMYAGCFYFAAFLIEEGLLPAERFDDVFKVLMALIFGAMTAGQAGSAAPDMGEAKLSANRILKLLNQESTIDPESEGGKQPQEVTGRVVFEGINFTYPTRPDIPVLRGLDLIVEPGETVALVGQSGCGKSTLIQLVERFYDGTSGAVKLDGTPVNQLNVQWLRRQIGFVQQEPILFNRSIRDNILFGSGARPARSSTKVSQVQPVAYDEKQIVAACDEANAKNFIEELPSSYDTGCGKRGSQLSGGQKQRVAIARALIRQPKILLLDEATSALDTESEKIVQDALNKASDGRTVILIAHRLSTVINADKIAVIDNGVIVEIGKHDELIAKQGAYYSLVNSQM